MKLIIPSYNRAENLTTPFLEVFKDFDIYLLLHSEEQKKDYLHFNNYDNVTVIVTNIDTKAGGGLPKQRKYAVDNILVDGEWCLFADDNVKSVYGVEDFIWHNEIILDKNKDDWENYSSKQFNNRVRQISEHADSVGAYHVGFLPAHNYFFANKKYREYGFCMGKMTMWKKDVNFIWNNYYTNSIEDFNHTAMHLVNYGKVLVVDFIYPIASHYSAGGIGNKKNRKQERIDSIKTIMKMYPDLFRKKKRPDNYPDISLKIMSQQKFIIWRKTYKEFTKKYKFSINNKVWEKL